MMPAEQALILTDRVSCSKPRLCMMYRWKASWQLMDAFETWRSAASQRRELRMKTASAFEHLYLSLGQRAMRAWQEGVSYQHKVCRRPQYLCGLLSTTCPKHVTSLRLLCPVCNWLRALNASACLQTAVALCHWCCFRIRRAVREALL